MSKKAGTSIQSRKILPEVFLILDLGTIKSII